MAPQNFVDVVQQHCDHQADRIALRFLLDGESREESLTFAQLHTAARDVARMLVDRGLQGKPVLLLFPPSLDYIVGLFACFYAGAIAVPAYPPDPSRLARTLPRLEALVADCRPGAVLAAPMIVAMAQAILGTTSETSPLRTVPWLPVDYRKIERAPETWTHHQPDASDVAFLQYTSGSTGNPRGVVLSHANLIDNTSIIDGILQNDSESAVVTWLPPYHDMGLIGCILLPLYAGVPTTMMSPLHFLQRPARWVEALSRFRATASPAPNFAYALTARKTSEADRAKLDLSAWRAAICGAEPIRAETMQSFVRHFEPVGFRASALLPAYGLAESTLIVTGVPQLRGIRTLRLDPRALEKQQIVPSTSDTARALVSSGLPVRGAEVLIVDPVSRSVLGSGRVGEVWLRGPSIARGYWGRPEETEATFGAELNGQRYLRTGDLGFLHEDELFIAGRVKDLIIVAGRNHQPQDIEDATEAAHAMVRRGSVAAFAGEGSDREVVEIALEVDVPRV